MWGTRAYLFTLEQVEPWFSFAYIIVIIIYEHRKWTASMRSLRASLQLVRALTAKTTNIIKGHCLILHVDDFWH